MVRPGMILLGMGLLILWLVGLGEQTAGWLLWLDFAAGLLSVVGGITLTEGLTRGASLAEPIVLAVALVAFWVVALATSIAPWQAWWTFAFACAYALLGVAGTSAERTGRHAITV